MTARLRNIFRLLRPILAGWLVLACGMALAADDRPTILLTADTEGRVHACPTCPDQRGLGEFDRRATLLGSLRKEHPGAILIDAGNALFGKDSIESGGAVIASAYAAMGYDLVNLSASDFRLGKAHTLDLLQQSKLKAISANLLDDATGQPIAEPLVVLPSGGRKIAFIGLAEAPPGLEALPNLKKQLAGIRFRPAGEALREWLPKAGVQADAVVVAYSGSPSGLRALQKSCGDAVLAILATGVRQEDVAAGGTPVIASAQKHGCSVGVVTLSGKEVKVDQALALLSLAADASMTALVDRYAPAPPPLPALAASTAPASPPAAQAMATTPAASPATMPAVAEIPATGPGSGAPPPPTASLELLKPAPFTTPVTAALLPPAQAPETPQPVVGPRPHGPAKGLAGVGLTAEQVNAAIDKGAAGLWKRLQDELKAKGTRLGASPEHALAAFALVRAGAHKRFADCDAELRYFLQHEDLRQAGTYRSGLLCLTIEAYGDPAFFPKLRQAARYLLEAQGVKGTWNYTARVPDNAFQAPAGTGAMQVDGGVPLDGSRADSETWRRLSRPEAGADGDNSVSQFALLGLQAAARHGVALPKETWQRALAETLARQSKDGGWDYNGPGHSYGSMTSAGVCAVAICRDQLGQKEASDHPAIERGLAWLDQGFTVKQNPASDKWAFYYLYSIERVGAMLDAEFIGANEWYPLGARYLVDGQGGDGLWVGQSEEADPRLASSFALLFLTRATVSLHAQPKRGGEGLLRTAAIAPPSRFYIILDASGSMLDDMEGKTKFDLARNAVRELAERLGPDSEVALRVYGHRLRSIDPKSDEDTELKIAMGRLDLEKFDAMLKSLRPRGKTPLSLSLDQAGADLRGVASAEKPVAVVLLTDGGEDTAKRRDPVAAAAAFGKLPNLTLQIVGFDIDQDDWRRQLQDMAAAAHAKYWPAATAAELQRSIRSVLGAPEEFTVLDKDDRPVASGSFGETKKLGEGRYLLQTRYAGQRFDAPFWINTDATTAVTFDASRVDPSKSAAPTTSVAPPPGVAAQSPPASAPAETPRFCTHCGAKLKPGAKFCTQCGAKVEGEAP